MPRPSLNLASFAPPLVAAPLHADDDLPPSAEGRERIEALLRAEGATRRDEIELDNGMWEADAVIGADGRGYDLTLDADFAIVEREPG